MPTHTTSGALLDLLGSPSIRRKGGSAGPQPFVVLGPSETLLVQKTDCACRCEIKGPDYRVDKWESCGRVDHDLDSMLMSVGERVLRTIRVWARPLVEQTFPKVL